MTGIFATVGPSTLNKKFLSSINKKTVNLLRINLSHTKVNELKKTINFIKKYTNIPICIDTEGAQVRTKSIRKLKLKLKKKSIIYINQANSKKTNSFILSPPESYRQIKKGDVLSIDFDSAQIRVISKNTTSIKSVVIQEGIIENNKGVSINRQIKLAPYTNKDIEAFKLANELKIENVALSFASSGDEIKRLRKFFDYPINIIAKIESKKGIKNLKNILNEANAILIDRGDLSREVSIERIPELQKKIIKSSKKNKKPVYVATNLLESMVVKRDPTRAEVNDIYNTLIDGANGLVLAAETAIGKYPRECIEMILRVSKVFQKNHKK